MTNKSTFMKMDSKKPIEKLIYNIVQKRAEKGLSLENVANELGLSVGAYHKIERQETKLNVERLFEIARIFDTKISELLDLPVENNFHQHVSEQSTGYQQHTLYQENMKVMQHLIEIQKDEISFLRNQILVLNEKVFSDTKDI